MAEHVVSNVTVAGPVTIVHKLDPDQFATLLAVFTDTDDAARIVALTAVLKESGDKLAAVIAANQPPTSTGT
jgi:hypothetical protein